MTMPDDDPCEILDQLRRAYRDLITGGKAQEVEHRSGQNGAVKRVVYGKADIGRLDREIARYEKLCAAACGMNSRPRRFGLRSGGH